MQQPITPLMHVSTGPHVRDPLTVSSMMLWVFIALVPAIIAAGCVFGMSALLVLFTTTATAVSADFLIVSMRAKKIMFSEASSAVTGLLLGLMLPASTPLGVACVGSLFAIIVVKQAFGGMGRNFINPALAGRLFIAVCYPHALATPSFPLIGSLDGIDGTSMATPLAHMKALVSHQGFLPLEYADVLNQLLWGTVGGCIGSTSTIAILCGGAILVYRRIISIRVPLLLISTVFIVFFLANTAGSLLSSEALIVPFYEIMSGGVMFAAFFIATDPVTTPLSRSGKVFFAVSIGLLIAAIRLLSNAVDGICFAILFMNCLVPLINRFSRPRPYGRKGLIG